MQEQKFNFRQYQSPGPDGGKMIKLILFVVLLIMVGWLVKRGLQEQPARLDSVTPSKELPKEIQNFQIDTLNN